MVAGINKNLMDESLCDIDATVDAFGEEHSDEYFGSTTPLPTNRTPLFQI